MTLNKKNHCRVALFGNPNCGKTTLFNVLTHGTQRVGNWPGVTVERKSGYLTYEEHTFEITDLPGLYALTSSEAALDERITCDFAYKEDIDIMLNIVDACHLERHLYLTLQLLERGLPLVVALNMNDLACAKGIEIDVEALSKSLGCEVVIIQANRGKGIEKLKEALKKASDSLTFPHIEYFPPLIKKALSNLSRQLAASKASTRLEWDAIRLLENEDALEVNGQLLPTSLREAISAEKQTIYCKLKEDSDILIASARYAHIDTLLSKSRKQVASPHQERSHQIDKILLHRFLGLPLFFAIMYAFFFFSINIGGVFQDFFDLSSEALLVQGPAHLFAKWDLPAWVTAVIANGIGKGINTTVTFIPVIGAMFLCLAFLEDSGYMARAAFIIDRAMRFLGLPGKAFVPMIVGFGCNVPAVMAARTLENKRDRILTIMMSPFMSCSARLAIYVLFTAAFFPQGGHNVVFALYLIGLLMAVLTGFMLRHTVLPGDAAPLVLELPPYHMPNIKTLSLHAWQRLRSFIFRAGKLIVPICALIGVLNSLNIDGSINTGDGDVRSILSIIGKWIAPYFSPMGITSDNWPAAVGLVTGVLAKEVVVGTLNTLYLQLGQLNLTAEAFSVGASLKQAFFSIGTNIAELGNVFSHPLFAKATEKAGEAHPFIHHVMLQHFDGKIGAFAYLLFILLYFPCVSTTAVMLRELHRIWSLFSLVWMTGVAYGSAVIFYQSATFVRHPMNSMLWITGMILLFTATLLLLRLMGDSKHELTPYQTAHDAR